MQQRLALAAAAWVSASVLTVISTPAFLPSWIAILAYLLVPIMAVHPGLARFVALPLVAAALSSGIPAWVLLAAAGVYSIGFLPSRLAQVIAPAAASASLGLSIYGSDSVALYVSLLAGISATLTAVIYSRRSMPLVVVAFCSSAMLLFSVPMLALSGSLSIVALVAAAASLTLFGGCIWVLRSSQKSPRLAACLAASVLLVLPVAFASGGEASKEIAPGIEASANFLECSRLGSNTLLSVECYAAALIDEFRTNGAESTIDLVDQLYEAPQPLGSHFAENCHESLHFLGKAIALSTDGDLRDVIAMGTDKCAAGFGHGVWEMEYGAMPTDVLVEQVPTICRGWEGYQRSEEGSSGIGCRHILGHTLATRFRGHVEDIAATCLIRDPEVDQESEWHQDEIIARNNCLAGLFMENFLDLNRFRTSDIAEGNPFETCEHEKIAAVDSLMWGCYNEIGAMVVPWYDYNMNASLRACQQQAVKNSIPEWVKFSCYDSITRSIGPALEYDTGLMEGACAEVDPGELRTYCVRGIAASVGFDSNDIQRAYEICKKNLPILAEQEICTTRIAEVSDSLDASKVANDDPSPPPTAPGASQP